ncbi:carbon storage regulator [Pseudomonas sp. NPDC086251]|uniref:carbon storage regulator n=1 Tax=Pseudomonas sp. NPDC086251 TaxID=3364431 RepID=UPI003837C0FE
MLILTRLPGERIFIGDDIVLKITSIDSDTVQLSLDAHPYIQIESKAQSLRDRNKGRPDPQAK